MKTNFVPFPTLTTSRLILRELQQEDSKEIFNYQSNPANYPFVNMVKYTEIKQADDYILKMNKGIIKNNWIIWAITIKGSNQIIGTISLWNLNHDTSVAELGYGLYPGNHSKGYMTEALNCVCEYGYNNMELMKIEAYTNEINQPSRKLLERTGFKTMSYIIEDKTKLVIYFKEKDNHR